MAVHKSRRSILFTKENVDSRKARKWLDLNHPSCFLQDLTYTLRTCCDDDIEIEITYEECRASIDERALTIPPLPWWGCSAAAPIFTRRICEPASLDGVSPASKSN
jgi:hypothetical protein